MEILEPRTRPGSAKDYCYPQQLLFPLIWFIFLQSELYQMEKCPFTKLSAGQNTSPGSLVSGGGGVFTGLGCAPEGASEYV